MQSLLCLASLTVHYNALLDDFKRIGIFQENLLADSVAFDMHGAVPKELPKITKQNWMEEPLTRGKMEPIIADLKDFIRVTVKGSENTHNRKIEGLENALNKKIEGTENVLRTEMQEMEKRLTEKIDNVGKRVDSHETRLSAVEEKIETHLTTHP